MNKTRHGIIMLLLALLCLPLCSARAETPRNLTLMVYMCGSDLESMFGSATEDLLEMREACSGNDDVTVLLMTGGTHLWTGNWIDAEETAIYEIRSRGLRKMESFPAMNMGQADTLSAFLEYGYANRPAEQYALIFWDHGAGPMEGVCFDQNNSMDSLSLQELEDGLHNSPFSGEAHLSWIGFDACLMATLETAIRCAPYADYMVASQETEPASGWNYAFLREIRRDREAQEICGEILDYYAVGKKDTDMLTISLLRLDKMQELGLRTDLFFDAIRKMLDQYTYSDISLRRQRTRSFGRVTTTSDYDLVDLYQLVDQYAEYAPMESGRLKQTLSQAVVRAAGNQERANGLSIYFPYYNKGAFSEKWMDSFRQFGILEQYRRFIDRFGAMLTGKPMAVWGHLQGYAGALAETGMQSVFLELTDDQLTHYAEGAVTILEDDGSGDAFYAVNYIPIRKQDGNTLEAEVSFEALYAVDENGIIETGAIPYSVIDDWYMVFAHLEPRSWMDPSSLEDEIQKVVLICREKKESKELEICSIIAIDDDTTDLKLGKQDFEPDPEKWRFIQFAGFPRTVQRDEEGSLLPHDQWPVEEHMLTISLDGIDRDGNRIPFTEWSVAEEFPQGMHHDTEADNTRPWTLKFCPQKTSGKDLVAQFDLMDTQGNHWGSELIPLQRPDVYETVSVDCEPKEAFGVTIQPCAIRIIRNDSFQGICLRVYVENHTEESVILDMLYPLINGISRNNTNRDSIAAFTGNRYILPGKSGISDYYFDTSCLPWQEDPIVRTISFVPQTSDGPSTYSLIHDLDRITVETELDVSMLPLQKRPQDPIASDSTPDGLVMELLQLQPGKAGENSVLRGTVRVMNPSEKSVWIGFINGKSDSLRIVDLNRTFLRDCLSIVDYDFLLSGGEGYYDFEVLADGDRSLHISPDIWLESSDGQLQEQELDRIGEIGFAHESISTDISDTHNAPIYLHQLILPEPIMLSDPCHILPF